MICITLKNGKKEYVIDSKFRFYADYMTINNYKFKYTEVKLQKHLEAIDFLQKPFEEFTKEEDNCFLLHRKNYNHAIRELYRFFQDRLSVESAGLPE